MNTRKITKIANIVLSVLLFVPVFLFVFYIVCPFLALLAIGILKIPMHLITKPVVIIVSVLLTSLIIWSAYIQQEKRANKTVQAGASLVGGLLGSFLVFVLIIIGFILYFFSKFGAQ